MSSWGYPVPPGFVIGIPALRAYSREIFRLLGDGEDDLSAERLEEIRRHILARPLPPPLRTAIDQACRSGASAWAVRSSMLGEDSQRSSFAGLLNTYLNVRGPSEVARTAVQCVASMCNWRLWSYQLESGRSRTSIRGMMAMAVVVQEMIEARVSGVAFGADPNTGSREVIIEAVPGTGEKLVGGRAAPHRHLSNDEGSLEHRPPRDGEPPLLAESEVRRLADAVRRISTRAGAPQDIEWAFDGRDFLFLQCRPITALPTRHVFSSRMVSEMSPGLITPLMWSTKTRSKVRTVFGRIAAEAIGQDHRDFAKYIKRIHSRLYADMTAFGEFLEELGLPGNFLEMMTRQEGPRRKTSPWRTVRPSRLPRLVRLVARHAGKAGEIEAFVEGRRRDLEIYRRVAFDELPPEGLMAIFDGLLRLHAQTQWHMFVGPMNMTVRFRLLERLLARRAPGHSAGQLLKGTGGSTALAPNAELAAMAPLVRKLPPDVPDLMLQAKIPELEARLAGLDGGRELLVRFRSFLSRFGFLSANGSDFTVVPWAEDAGPVWQSIARFARQAENGVGLRAEAAPADPLPQVRRRLNVIERRLFDRLWASTRRYMELREATSLIMSEETYLMRRALLGLAARLGKQGSLESPSDIFYLYHDELRDRLAGRLADGAVRERIARRKEEMARDAGIRVPETLSGGSEAVGPTVQDGEDYLGGIGASPGRAHGTARIISDPSRPGRPPGEDDILVVPFTDVGWTPLLPGVRGIVAETGGQLSHTSIIAREYGLPAVVGVKEATRLIREGELITIDGTLGRVYRHTRLRAGRQGVSS